jgi:hypothetical protein
MSDVVGYTVITEEDIKAKNPQMTHVPGKFAFNCSVCNSKASIHFDLLNQKVWVLTDCTCTQLVRRDPSGKFVIMSVKDVKRADLEV